MDNVYKIVDEFQAGNTDVHVLVLDHDYDFLAPVKRGIAVIDGIEHPFHPQSIRRWVTINSHDSFLGRTVRFF